MEVDTSFPLIRSRLTQQGVEAVDPLVSEILSASWRSQWVDDARWSAPLTVQLADLGMTTVGEVGPRVVDALGGNVRLPSGGFAWSPEGMRNYTLAAASGVASRRLIEAQRYVRTRRDDLDAALQRVGDMLTDAPRELVFSMTNASAVDAGKVLGATRKRWQVNSGSSRDSHAALNGVEVAMSDRFPNGLRFPGSPGPPEETVNCECSVILVKEDAA